MVNFASLGGVRRQGLAYLDVGVAVIVGIFFLFVQATSQGTPLCFDDCNGYIQLSFARNTGEYFETLARQFRTFPVPVIFSMFGSYDLGAGLRIVQFQTLLYFTAWLILALAISSRISHWIVRRVAFLAVLSLMFTSALPGLNLYLLSDSLSMSLQLLMLSVLMRCDLLVAALSSPSVARRYGALAGFALLAAFAIPARDTNAIFLLVVFMAAPFMVRPGYRLHALACTVIVAIAALATLQSASASARAQFNMRNIIAARVFTDPQALAFFQDRGLPTGPEVTEFAADFLKEWKFDPHGASPKDVRPGGPLLVANEYLSGPLREFLPRARSVYTKYLILHPTLVLQTLASERNAILNPLASAYSTAHLNVRTQPCERPCNPAVVKAPPEISIGDLLPLDPLLVLAAGALAIRLWYGRRARIAPWNDRALCFALALAVGGMLCALAAFLGDYWETSEMLRHTMAGSVFFKLGCLLLVLLAAESLCPPVARVPQVWRGWLSRAAKTETA